MWTYHQSTGELAHNDLPIGVGYAGHGHGRNNPLAQHEHFIGPLPRNFYTIGKGYTHASHGPITMDLTPDPAGEMYGRSAFQCHGDSIRKPGSASNGCIVLSHEIREMIDASDDRTLQVVR